MLEIALKIFSKIFSIVRFLSFVVSGFLLFGIIFLAVSLILIRKKDKK